MLEDLSAREFMVKLKFKPVLRKHRVDDLSLSLYFCEKFYQKVAKHRSNGTH